MHGDDGEYFSGVKLNNKPLSECELVLENNKSDYRLYIQKDTESRSFYAMAICAESWSSRNSKWDCPELQVTQLFNVTAHFDGVRHLEFNREAGEMSGYIFCPNMEALTEMFAKIRQLELQYCLSCDKI